MKRNSLNRLKRIPVVFLIAGFLLSASQSHAQIYNDSSKKYKLFIEPYLMFTSMSGTTGLGNLPNTFICVPASEVFSHLKIGGMLYAEVHNDKLAYTSDLFYANLTQDASTKNNVVSGTAGLKQFLWELEGLYRLNPWLEVGVGARINNITADLNINYSITTPGGPSTGSSNSSKSNTWVDPLIVVRMKKVVQDKWLFQLRADIGGFGVGSQFAYQLQPDIFYRASRLMQFGVGYRLISMNYNNNKSGSDYFLYDMEEYGPQIRIGFNF
jgi:hypothetical protein